MRNLLGDVLSDLLYGPDDARPHPRVFVCGRREPLCDCCDPRAWPHDITGSPCHRNSRCSTTTSSSAPLSCSTSIEFFADKIPYVDTLWDMIHTAIRPIGGALMAVTTLGEASPAVAGLVALLGGTVAAGSHLTKTSTRAAANASPEPFSNWILSIGEDLFVVGLGFLALQYPVVALAWWPC